MFNTRRGIKKPRIKDKADSLNYAFSMFDGSKNQRKTSNPSNRVLYLPSTDSYSFTNNQSLELPSHDYLVDGTCGVDKVRLQLEIDPDSIYLPDFMGNLLGKNNDHRLEGKLATIPGYPPVHIKWDMQKHLLSLTFNPSHFTKLLGLEICPMNMFKDICQSVISKIIATGDIEAKPKFQFNKTIQKFESKFEGEWGKYVYIRLLDLARDFKITDSRFHLEQHVETIPKNSKASVQYRNKGAKLNTISHTHAKNVSGMKLYDKFEERKKNRITGIQLEKYKNVMRFEVTLSNADLSKYGLTNLDSFNEKSANLYLKYKWNQSRWGEPLIWGGQKVTEIHEEILDSKEANELIGYAISIRYNLDSDYGPKELLKKQAQLKKLKIKTHIDLSRQGKPYGYLDFETGDIKLL